jgi:hypothetical protein
MIICIDYDDTYTADPEMWDTFAAQAIARGHDVWCVSARADEFMDKARYSIGLVIGDTKCVGTNGAAKRDYLFKTRGVYGDIWIDDMPETVSGAFAVKSSGLWVAQFDGASTDKSGAKT